jgi:hypothetical protein
VKDVQILSLRELLLYSDGQGPLIRRRDSVLSDKEDIFDLFFTSILQLALNMCNGEFLVLYFHSKNDPPVLGNALQIRHQPRRSVCRVNDFAADFVV